MAPRKKSIRKNEKTVDLPPTGPRNSDPLTDAPGAHPIETGIGATVAGAAAGLAVGAVGGPVGAVIGATVGGAVAGGLVGKGIGELIDPTTEDAWLREYFGSRPASRGDESPERFRDAFRHGLAASERHRGRTFDEVEPELQASWEAARGPSMPTWGEVRDAVRHAFDRGATIVVTETVVCTKPATRRSDRRAGPRTPPNTRV
jgi:hypothetical protein